MAAPEESPVPREETVSRISVNWTPEFGSYTPTAEQPAWTVCTLKAPFYEPTSRAPVDIVAVIDKSGSMRGEKLTLVKATLEFVIDQLKECDRLSVVTYDTNVRLDFPLTRMNGDNKEKTKALVRAIIQGSSTNLCGGLIKGMEQILERTGDKAKVASVLLLTDGLANQGISNRDGIMAEMRKLIDPPPGRPPFEGTVYTFGFGADHDAKLLEGVSTQGGGVYYYIDSTEKVPESFADCLGGLLSVVGQNITLKLEASGDNKITNVHTSRPTSWKTPNKCCEVAMGDLQSEEERDILVQLTIPAVTATSDTAVVAKLLYFNVITSAMETVECNLVLERNDNPRGESSKKLDSQRNRILTTNALKDARKLADEGKYDQAKKLLQDTVQIITTSVSAGEEYCQGLISDLTRAQDSMKSQIEYKKHGAHFMMNKMQSHAVQRSNYASSEFTPYSSSSKGEFVAKSKAVKKW